MTQYVINIGTIPNDGTGDPLRTAFNDTNLNFNQVFAAGPVGSNVQIANNTILTTNTNGNLVLAPNGIGIVQSNVSIVPNTSNIRNLGLADQRWATIYGQYLDITSANIASFSNLTISVANLHITGGSNGYVLQTDGEGNLTWTEQTGGGGNVVPGGANTQIQFNDAGVFGGAPGFTFDKTTNVLSIGGNISSNNLLNSGLISATGNILGGNLISNALVSARGNNGVGENSAILGAVGYTELNANVIAQITGNTNNYTQINFQNINNGTRATTDYIATAAFGTDSTYFVDMGIAGGNYDSSNPNNSLGNSLYAQDSYLYAMGGNSVGGFGGNLVVGSNEPGGVVRVIANGSTTDNIVATFSNVGIDVKGNIVPVTSNTYSLGNSTNQWSDLWVSNATIYMNSVPISLTAGNVLTVDGADVVTADVNGNINVNNITSTVNVSIETSAELVTVSVGLNDWVFDETGVLTIPSGANISNNAFNAGSASASVALNAFSPDGNTVSMQAQGNTSSAVISVFANSGPTTYNWIFDSTGNLNLPTNGDLNFNAGGIVQVVDEDFKILVQDADDDGFALLQQVDDGGGNVLGSTELQRDRFTVQFASGSAPQFVFNDNGEFSVPGNIRTTEYVNSSLYAVSDNSENGSVELKVISFASDLLGSNVRVTQSNAYISTANALHTWNFDLNGNLTLPLSGNLVGSTANNNGYINWLGNSSGDGNGYTTMRLVPDDTRESSDQYLVIDPTAPGHIHIRAGGTQDNSSADLFLGGENSYFKVASGANAEVQVTSNSNTWVFNTDGNLQVPGNINGDNAAPLVIDGASSGEGYISLPSASFGGEQIAIVNKFSLGNGIRLETNGGNLFFDNAGDLTAPGNITGNTAGYAIGYRDIPQVSFTGNATIAITDAGKHFYSTQSSNYTLTIANNASQGFQVGAAITVVNQGTGTITIAEGPGVTLYLAGNVTSGNRSVATFGMATLIKVATDTWFINGTGVS